VLASVLTLPSRAAILFPLGVPSRRTHALGLALALAIFSTSSSAGNRVTRGGGALPLHDIKATYTREIEGDGFPQSRQAHRQVLKAHAMGMTE